MKVEELSCSSAVYLQVCPSLKGLSSVRVASDTAAVLGLY